MRTLATLLGVAALIVVASASADGGPQWGAPVQIAPLPDQPLTYNRALNPHVAVNARGDAAVVVNMIEGAARYPDEGLPRLIERSRGSGGDSDWSAPRYIAQTRQAARLHLDRNGDAAVAYFDGYARAAQRVAGGQWGAYITLSSNAFSYYYDFAEAANDRGDVAVAWAATNPYGQSAVEVSVRIGGTWSRSTRLSEGTRVDTAIDNAGNVVVIWQNDGVVATAFRSAADGTWTEPTQLDTDARYSDVHVGFDNAGNATALWMRSYAVVAHRAFGGAWRVPDEAFVEDPRVKAIGGLAVCGNGSAMFLADGAGAIMAAATREGATGRWQDSEVPGSHASWNARTDLACDTDGNAVAAWTDNDAVWASLRPAGGDWESVRRVAAGTATALSVAVDDRGRALLAWADETFGQTWVSTVQLAELSAAGPILQDLSVPHNALVRRMTGLSVAARPWGARIRRVVWMFGDGKTATGQRVKHVFRRRGTYTVSVSARDAAGFTTTATATVTVHRR